jgi:hypothetical protein
VERDSVTTADPVAPVNGGVIGVAAFGTLYLGLASPAGAAHPTHAFAITAVAFAALALLAAATAIRAVHSPNASHRPSARATALGRP